MKKETKMIRLYDYWESGNCYKVRLPLSLLGEPFERGYEALGVMESQLAIHDWFAGPRLSIADIALYAYTHVAEEGKFELERFPAVQAWLERVAAQPGHVGIEDELGTLVAWPG